jgi:tetratricopeptide (TPR) repeat protein
MSEEQDNPKRSSLVDKIVTFWGTIRRKAQEVLAPFKSYASFKKVSALAALIGVIIGALVGTSTIVGLIQRHGELSREIRTRLEVGKRFQEQWELDRAVEEYQKVLVHDRDNMEAHRRIIAIELLRIESKEFRRDESFPEINDILLQIYQLQALHPPLKKDVELLLQEARLLLHRGSFQDSLRILEEVRRLRPGDPEVLALLGRVHVLASPEDKVEGFDLLRQAVAIRPNQALYHYYLASAYEKTDQDADAIREYYGTATLLTGQNTWSWRLRARALEELDDMFMRCFAEDGALTATLDMPLEERAQIYDYLVTHMNTEYVSGVGFDGSQPRNGYLAAMYYKLGDLEKAHQQMKSMLSTFGVDYGRRNDPRGAWIAWAELHVKILEESGLDPNTLAEARQYVKAIRDDIKRGEESEKELDVLEVLSHATYGTRYRVGLRVPNAESDEGVLVLKVFEEYPFAKAGVLEGDRILEIAHREVHAFNDIQYALTELFERGTAIPVKVKRGNETLLLTLVIE